MKRREVAIVGGGPAGLSAARRLHELGIRDVVVLEREREAGGVPRHCGHTGFGLREFKRLLQGPGYTQRLAQAADGLDEIRRAQAFHAISGRAHAGQDHVSRIAQSARIGRDP